MKSTQNAGPENSGLNPLTPHMQPNELELFEKYLGKAKIYVEFGCGGSTYRALDFNNIKEIHSVESDIDWLKILEKYPKIGEACESGRLHLHHKDIGPVKAWGVPIDTSKINNWPDYHWGVWKKLPQNPDFILIDGRFRVAATLVVCLLFNQLKDLKIAIHDFSKRPHYFIVKDFLTEIDTKETLSIFTIKPDLNFRHLFLNLYKYLFVFK